MQSIFKKRKRVACPAILNNSLCLTTFLVYMVLFLPCSEATQLTDEASQLFNQSKKSVFQIRVIDLATEEKSSAGSGFCISQQGHLITNYHVVSNYVHKPEQYRVTYIKNDGTSVNLKLIHIDVLHDLALLKTEEPIDGFLELGNSNMPKGEKIFSMGNPHDLGMSIIEGTFNGVMEHSMYRKILFSASLNSGMSGGPALNHQGQVIGVNVSTRGNDISFLVPVEFLKDLYQKAIAGNVNPDRKEWHSVIQEQLLVNQDQFVKELVAIPWETLKLDQFTVPGKLSNNIKCWGKSFDEEKEKISKIRTKCSSVDYIFLSRDVYTFYFSYWFTHHRSKNLSTFRLYNHLQNDFKNAFSFDNEDNEQHTKFRCKTEFVEVAGRSWKTAMCVRGYKKFPKLYDFNLILSAVDQRDESAVGELIGMGLSKARGQELIRKFMESIEWQK